MPEVSSARGKRATGAPNRAPIQGESNFTFSNMFIKVSKTNITTSHQPYFFSVRGIPGDARFHFRPARRRRRD
ncbi:hypothetical protein BCAR13_680053 [Paraburkholderia caribensis]|nr:hypothetical protein BCAR13_680053 [Paraburkholderia caribensis]